MFDPSPYLPEPEPRSDRVLETVTRFAAFFATGILVTQLVRLFGELQPFFWIVCIAGLIALGVAVHLTRKPELIAVAAIVVAGILAGYWDGLAHGATQAANQIEEGILK